MIPGGPAVPSCLNWLTIPSMCESDIQWNPSKADNLEPHILPIIVGCPLWRGCIDVNGKTIGTQKFVHYIEVSVIEGCLLSGVPL